MISNKWFCLFTGETSIEFLKKLKLLNLDMQLLTVTEQVHYILLAYAIPHTSGLSLIRTPIQLKWMCVTISKYCWWVTYVEMWYWMHILCDRVGCQNVHFYLICCTHLIRIEGHELLYTLFWYKPVIKQYNRTQNRTAQKRQMNEFKENWQKDHSKKLPSKLIIWSLWVTTPVVLTDLQGTLVEEEDQITVNEEVFAKPFVEKPVSAEDHNVYIYFPSSAGGGSQRLFRKVNVYVFPPIAIFVQSLYHRSWIAS